MTVQRLTPAARPVPARRCAVCRTAFVPHNRWARFCGKRCVNVRTNARRNPTTERACLHCGASFVGTQGRRFCVARCATVYHRQADRDRRRAARPDEHAERIFRRRIFDRDGWVCGVCRHDVDPALPATDPEGATLDHIVPLARGGRHTEANVQLAHWSCNRRKAASVAP